MKIVSFLKRESFFWSGPATVKMLMHPARHLPIFHDANPTVNREVLDSRSI